MGCAGVVDGDEPHALVEACCVCIYGAEAHVSKVCLGVSDEGGD